MKTTSTKSMLRNMGLARLIAIVLTLFSFGKVIAVPLSGTYTAGATETYSTFAPTVAHLTTNEISAPVTFNVQVRTYAVSSPLTIGAITSKGSQPFTQYISGTGDGIATEASVEPFLLKNI